MTKPKILHHEKSILSNVRFVLGLLWNFQKSSIVYMR